MRKALGSAFSAARASVFVNASKPVAWRALSDPAMMAGWLADSVNAPDGLFAGASLCLSWESLGISLPLVVEANEPETRLLLSATLGHRAQQLDVRVRGDGDRTEVALTHTGFAATARGRDECAGQKAGWHASLRILKRYVERHMPARRRSQAVATTWVAGFDAVEAALFSAAGLGRWLCPGGALVGSAEGDGAQLRLPGDVVFAGEILARVPPRELVIADDERCLRLRAIAQDGEVGLGPKLLLAQVWTYSDAASLDRIRDAIATAFAHLPGDGSAAS